MNPVWVGSLVALVTLVLAIMGWMGRLFWRVIRRVDQFLEDWNGTAGDTRGHEARPGIMQRLMALERAMGDIQGQVHLNGGASMRDEVTRNTTMIRSVSAKVDKLNESVEELKAR